MNGGPSQSDRVKLNKSQAEKLGLVCRTNGGGVNIRCRRRPDGTAEPVNGSYRKLYELGLIQGKAGGFESVVHTREGLALYRKLIGVAA